MLNAAPLWCVLIGWGVWGVLVGWIGPLARAGRGRAVQSRLPAVWDWLDRGLGVLIGAATAVGGLYLLAALRGWFLPAGYGVPGFLAWLLVGLWAMGALLAAWGKAALGPNYAPRSALKVEHRLVAGGPYAHIRHPIYAGLVVMYAAAGVLSGSWLVLALGAGLVPACYGVRIWLDERLLHTGFGSAYATYARQVPVLLPRVQHGKRR
jgi:protein-S-isoprenylcysteine O-methyltransferase Ste14